MVESKLIAHVKGYFTDEIITAIKYCYTLVNHRKNSFNRFFLCLINPSMTFDPGGKWFLFVCDRKLHLKCTIIWLLHKTRWCMMGNYNVAFCDNLGTYWPMSTNIMTLIRTSLSLTNKSHTNLSHNDLPPMLLSFYC